jgi:uncharacterized membrane protein
MSLKQIVPCILLLGNAVLLPHCVPDATCADTATCPPEIDAALPPESGVDAGGADRAESTSSQPDAGTEDHSNDQGSDAEAAEPSAILPRDAGADGTDYDVRVGDCSPNPCLNGGTCTSGPNAFSCACKPGFAGLLCQTTIIGCLPNPCLNSGVCSAAADGFACACKPGFSGSQCQTNIDDCTPNPCLNAGTCSDKADGNGYACMCKAGFTGPTCATNVDDCVPNPCLHSGVCTDKPDGSGYSCACKTGFSGPTCATNIDDCTPNPCLHGGTCTDKLDGSGYACACGASWTGGTCALARFEGLGFLSQYTHSTLPLSVNADGSVVVGYSESVDEDNSEMGFRWTKETGLVALSATCCSAAYKITPNARTIIGYSSAGYPAVYWTDGVFHALQGFEGDVFVTADAVNGDGSVIVGWSGSAAVRWVKGGPPERLVPASVMGSWATGVSTDGTVIVGEGAWTAGRYQPFRWTESEGAVVPPGTDSFTVYGLSGDGQVMIGTSGLVAARSPAGGPGTLGINGRAYDTNTNGTVIVGTGDAGAFVWNRGTVQLLSALVDTTGWTALDARGVSADGKTVVGSGQHNGKLEGWIARLP